MPSILRRFAVRRPWILESAVENFFVELGQRICPAMASLALVVNAVSGWRAPA
jgi:hypothetical protein